MIYLYECEDVYIYDSLCIHIGRIYERRVLASFTFGVHKEGHLGPQVPLSLWICL